MLSPTFLEGSYYVSFEKNSAESKTQPRPCEAIKKQWY